MKVVTKTQYFIDGVQVLRINRGLAKELGVSETVLRSWADSPDFPQAIHTHKHSQNIVRYFPYEPAMAYLARKLAKYAQHKARGIGRPNKA